MQTPGTQLQVQGLGLLSSACTTQVIRSSALMFSTESARVVSQGPAARQIWGNRDVTSNCWNTQNSKQSEYVGSIK